MTRELRVLPCGIFPFQLLSAGLSEAVQAVGGPTLRRRGLEGSRWASRGSVAARLTACRFLQLIDLASPLIQLSPAADKENVDSPLLKF